MVAAINSLRDVKFARIRNVVDKATEIRKAADQLSAYISKVGQAIGPS